MGLKQNLGAAKLLRLLRIPDGSSWESEGPWSRRGSNPPAGFWGKEKPPLGPDVIPETHLFVFRFASVMRVHARPSCKLALAWKN